MDVTQPQEVSTQVAVVGGGLSGVCAAIASARLGAETVLVHDRPVLGGNSSSEIRMHICGGASGQHRFGRETGIIEELRLENAFRNPYDRPPLWDWVLWEFVRRELKLTLWLGTHAGEQVELTADGAIQRVLCRQAHTEKTFWLAADLFVDCSGDCGMAVRAGAEFRMGREARREFDESMAPEEADACVLGSSLMFEVRDLGRPVPFAPPSWAKEFPADDDLPFRHHALRDPTGGHGVAKGFWWIEFGGRVDTIADDEAIRDELISILFGIWDHIKNHGDHGAENYLLDWVGAVPGKRESRRLMGDYVLRQSDVEGRVLFPDRVAYGGWPIDLHPPDGIYSPEPACEQVYLDDFYSIPFRCLYSRKIPNLLFAGRNISASHVVLGSTRVMGTCAVLGQAVGTAAALAVRQHLRPRELGNEHVAELQQQLLRDDCYIIDLRRDDPDDLARGARITASSVRAVEMVANDASPAVLGPGRKVAQGFLAAGNRLDAVELLLSAPEGPVEVHCRLCRSDGLKLYRPKDTLAEVELTVASGEPCWVSVEMNVELDPGYPYFIELEGDGGTRWNRSALELPGTQTARWDEKDKRWQRAHGTFCFRLRPEHLLFRPEYVVSGISRPEEEPHLWISQAPLPQWLEFEFDELTTVGELNVTFDTDLTRQFPTATPAICVRHYRLEGLKGDTWQTVFEEAANHQRHRRHTFPPVTADRYRLTVLEMWGASEARICEVRLYAD